ncbi:hypothetical protein HETIRDRAFT_324231 [Heterobasidion irregulare TC 32-1]|uniref:Uncharacterized protein n=1 Tax=Heterobasidion irregulare (strain TC 32-1) TaxID=747525 RepID=W4JZP8_HETIT|nr:uncharacterized protein HETIRDRAFT_324231 [Heterobasidion irregulare TC 32-1]ETW78565.1 hypothetical protein HETIRDRAFT_324231 [Heterobasidion irregulare TC 32-1]
MDNSDTCLAFFQPYEAREYPIGYYSFSGLPPAWTTPNIDSGNGNIAIDIPIIQPQVTLPTRWDAVLIRTVERVYSLCTAIVLVVMSGRDPIPSQDSKDRQHSISAN